VKEDPIKLLTWNIPVQQMQWALKLHPEYWSENTARTEHPSSPHHDTQDIWARFSPPGVDGSQPHDSEWYPCADYLPIKNLVYPLFNYVQGTRLGGVLITRIPPGKSVKPHTDPGWHARYYEKFAIQIESAPEQAFHFDECSLVTKPGDVFWFDNSFKHWVTNDSSVDRVTAIICIRR
jgi:hypothetical protein